MIPRLLHFIWLPFAYDLPPKERHYIHQWQQMNAGFGVMIWGEKEIELLIERRYPEMAGLWSAVTNKGKRSDIARYLILSSYGGFYIDADQEPIKSLDHFLTSRLLYSFNDRRTINPSHAPYPVDIKQFDIIIGSDNYSARPSNEDQNILTNCFIAATPTVFWYNFVVDRLNHFNDTVLNSFGTWALTDYIRKHKPARLLELPSYYFNWIPKHMGDQKPFHYTYALHHSSMKWVEEASWFTQK